MQNPIAIAALKASLTSAWDNIPEQVVHDSCAQLPDRLRGVIKAKGGYVENVCGAPFVRH